VTGHSREHSNPVTKPRTGTVEAQGKHSEQKLLAQGHTGDPRQWKEGGGSV
jgi:hypothetical protein